MPIAEAVRVITDGWTQAKIAEVLDSDQGTVSKMLRGVGRKFSLEQIAAIEDAAGEPRGTVLAMAGLVTPDGVRAAKRRLETVLNVTMKDGEVDNVVVVGTRWVDDSGEPLAAASGTTEPGDEGTVSKPSDAPEQNDA